MAEHHALVDIHHEVIAPPVIDHLPYYAEKTIVTHYQPCAVGKKPAHAVSDQLSKRYPYPERAAYNFTEPSTAYGRNAVSKTMQVLNQLVEEGQDSPQATVVKRANIVKLLEALYDHNVIGDSLAGEAGTENVALLKQLLSDSDAEVRKGAAQALGRFAILIQGRKAICDSGCTESLAMMLDDLDSADVRLAAGKTLHVLTQSIDGRDEVADNVSEGKVVVTMVRALLAISAVRSQVATPGLVEVLLEALSNLLKAEKAIELALQVEIMPFVVYTLKRRRHNAEALKTLVSLCGHPDGKKAAIEAGALQAVNGLLASEKPLEKQLSARAVLLMCADQEGKDMARVVVPNLVHQLYEEDHDMYMNALLALRSISEWPATREAVMKVLEDHPEMKDEIFSDHQIHLAAFRYDPNKPERI
eukprot:CAMPEP_0181317392 /NCGR_PEP_ID=MMETSP1101-20121128/16443_1 /TAXON_ID=46948 /ORGANISM="Rhodomonas abbreviata, Strain Caron Lab Isolate" /LENGTH=416 /DNA_ID=CAMNT_0023424781 /DNA_START=92 /DNA_END=1342 /DNA_ORIENTATION=-